MSSHSIGTAMSNWGTWGCDSFDERWNPKFARIHIHVPKSISMYELLTSCPNPCSSRRFKFLYVRSSDSEPMSGSCRGHDGVIAE